MKKNLTPYSKGDYKLKNHNVELPYKAIGYPILPAIYILMGLTFCTLLIIYKP